MRKFLAKLKLYWLEKRGEAVVDQREFWEFIKLLSTDLIPDSTNEIPRDLFRILAFWWAVTARKDVEQDPHEVLRQVREKAWLAYTDMPKTLENVRTDFPDTPSRQRILDYFEELDQKQSTYVFLPVVSSIDRHQGAKPASSYSVDRIMDRMKSGTIRSLVRQSFLLAPHASRERDVLMLALATQTWGRPQVARSPMEFYKLAATHLRALYDDPAGALSAVEKDAADNDIAEYLLASGAEIATEAGRPILLETLYIVENWITGPKHFTHAFEVTEKWF